MLRHSTEGSSRWSTDGAAAVTTQADGRRRSRRSLSARIGDELQDLRGLDLRGNTLNSFPQVTEET